MATTFIGFSAQQQHTLQADLTLAKKLAMGAVNSMLLTVTGRPADQTAQLLWWVFTVRADQDVWDRVVTRAHIRIEFYRIGRRW